MGQSTSITFLLVLISHSQSSSYPLKMLQFLVLASAALLSFTEAKICTNITIPVNLNARNGIYNLSEPTDPSQVTLFAQLFTRRGVNLTDQLLEGYSTINGQYNIAATYCVPTNCPPGTNGSTVQFLTHGIGFDRRYFRPSYYNDPCYLNTNKI